MSSVPLRQAMIVSLGVALVSCQPTQAEPESMRILSETIDPDDPETTVVSYLPTRVVSTDITGQKVAPLGSIRWSDEKVVVQGWVALLDATKADREAVTERIDGKVRFEPVPVGSYHITMTLGETELDHPVMEGRFGEVPAALNLELSIPTQEDKEVIDVELAATVIATGRVKAATTQSATVNSREEAEAIMQRLFEKKTTKTTSEVSTTATVDRGAESVATYAPILATLPVKVAASMKKEEKP